MGKSKAIELELKCHLFFREISLVEYNNCGRLIFHIFSLHASLRPSHLGFYSISLPVSHLKRYSNRGVFFGVTFSLISLKNFGSCGLTKPTLFLPPPALPPLPPPLVMICDRLFATKSAIVCASEILITSSNAISQFRVCLVSACSRLSSSVSQLLRRHVMLFLFFKIQVTDKVDNISQLSSLGLFCSPPGKWTRVGNIYFYWNIQTGATK